MLTMVSFPRELSKGRPLDLFARGVILGADGSRLVDGAKVYALPARQIVEIDYWHGYQLHVEKGIVLCLPDGRR